MAKGMNVRHAKFVVSYLKSGNATTAAIEAGYSKKVARQIGSRLLLTNDDIKNLVSSKIAKAGVTVEYVLAGIKEIAERCMQRVPVMVRDPADGRKFIQKTDDDGEGVWEFDSTGANTAMANLGKYLKMFTDKIEVKGGVVHSWEDLVGRP